MRGRYVIYIQHASSKFHGKLIEMKKKSEKFSRMKTWIKTEKKIDVLMCAKSAGFLSSMKRKTRKKIIERNDQNYLLHFIRNHKKNICLSLIKNYEINVNTYN